MCFFIGETIAFQAKACHNKIKLIAIWKEHAVMTETFAEKNGAEIPSSRNSGRRDQPGLFAGIDGCLSGAVQQGGEAPDGVYCPDH